jgi:hypothetical protein
MKKPYLEAQRAIGQLDAMAADGGGLRAFGTDDGYARRLPLGVDDIAGGNLLPCAGAFSRLGSL